MKKIKKMVCVAIATMLVGANLVACGGSASSIAVVSREEGSGTRGAFVELFGIEQKNESGEKIDHTTDEAEITNSTSVMMTTVAGNPDAIGYISLGSLDDSVKVLEVNGVEASVKNVSKGSYTIARPFNIATGKEVSEVAADFINYIMSADGQAIIEENGYIKASDAVAFESNGATGKIVVAGSSSVSPVMQKLKEAYLAVNTGAEIEIQTNDSTTGMTSTLEGICDIGMASRELSDSEVDGGLTATVIAMDGIAVIVNKDNQVSNITSEQVMNIYMGDTTSWDDITK